MKSAIGKTSGSSFRKFVGNICGRVHFCKGSKEVICQEWSLLRRCLFFFAVVLLL